MTRVRWAAIALFVVVVLAGLVWFLTRPDDQGPTQATAPAPSTSAPAATTDAPAPATEAPLPTGTPDAVRPVQGTSTLVEDLEVGDCLWSPVPRTDLKLGYAMNTVPCTERHSAEVYGLYQVPDQPYFGQQGQITQGSPGDVDLNCPDPVALQARHPDDSLRLALFYPTEKSWNAGAHTAACIVSIETSSGSAEYPEHL